MFVRVLGGALLGLALCVVGAGAGGGAKEKKDAVKDAIKDKKDVVKDAVKDKKDAAKEKKDAVKDAAKDKKKERPDPRKIKGAVEGKVKSLDETKMSFTITLESGKDRSFGVNDKTEFIGPLGGKGEGLGDDRMAKGNSVVVVPIAGDDKTAKEVHFGYRKKIEKKEEEKKKKVDKK